LRNPLFVHENERKYAQIGNIFRLRRIDNLRKCTLEV
jgi:hypothetical protein